MFNRKDSCCWLIAIDVIPERKEKMVQGVYVRSQKLPVVTKQALQQKLLKTMADMDIRKLAFSFFFLLHQQKVIDMLCCNSCTATNAYCSSGTKVWSATSFFGPYAGAQENSGQNGSRATSKDATWRSWWWCCRIRLTGKERKKIIFWKRWTDFFACSHLDQEIKSVDKGLDGMMM